VFLCKGVEYGLREVVDCAWLRGDLEVPWSRFLDSLSCERHAEELNLEPEEEALQLLSDEYRYEADLVSAEETERWLERRGINEEEFGAYFARLYWRDHVEPLPPGKFSRPDFPRVTEDIRGQFLGDLLISGDFDRLALTTSWRVAALATSSDSGGLPDTTALDAFLSERGLKESDFLEQLAKLGRDRHWLEICAFMEAAFNDERQQPLNTPSRARALAGRRLALTRVELETTYAPTSDAAREFVLCLRECQGPASELAAECGFEFEKMSVFLEDCPPDLQPALLSAAPGEALPPREAGDRYAVCRLAGKTDPALTDPAVLERIDRRLIEIHFNELSAGRVRWIDRPL
jgi:hypothetical protein